MAGEGGEGEEEMSNTVPTRKELISALHWFDSYYCRGPAVPDEIEDLLDQIREPEVSEGACKCGQHAQKHTKTCAACFADEAEYLLEERVQW